MDFFTSYDWMFWLMVVYALIPILLLIEDERKNRSKQDSRKKKE